MSPESIPNGSNHGVPAAGNTVTLSDSPYNDPPVFLKKKKLVKGSDPDTTLPRFSSMLQAKRQQTTVTFDELSKRKQGLSLHMKNRSHTSVMAPAKLSHSHCGPLTTDRHLVKSPEQMNRSTTMYEITSPEDQKLAKKRADEAIMKGKIFAIQGPYFALREELRRRGWVEKFCFLGNSKSEAPNGANNHHLTSSSSRVAADGATDSDDDADPDDQKTPASKPWEEMGGFYASMSRQLKNIDPTFIWSVKRDQIDGKNLRKDQLFNHYAKAHYFTTKVGLCQNLREVAWLEDTDIMSFFPRCYLLSNEEERAEFIDDFRLTACISLLKVITLHYLDTPIVKLAEDAENKLPNTDSANDQVVPQASETVQQTVPFNRVIPLAIKHCEYFLRERRHEDLDSAVEQSPILPIEWESFLNDYYNIVHDQAVITGVTPNGAAKCRQLLEDLIPYVPQYNINGYHDVWIVKPGAKSRGRGIQCYCRLDKILRLVSSTCTRDGKFVIQKYIEKPLLIENTKFDIRQWFLVTDWTPLTVYWYKDCYLRFCSQQFSLTNFHESIHLSNNCVQKNYQNGERSKMLPDDNMWTSNEFRKYLYNLGHTTIWESKIQPAMQKAIIGVLRSVQDMVEPRKNSFEVYGADFMISEDFNVWLIEINTSPSVSTSTAPTALLVPHMLEDTLKVVLDKRSDKNGDTGRFQLLYKDPNNNLQNYIGLNLSIDGEPLKMHKNSKAHEGSNASGLSTGKFGEVGSPKKSVFKTSLENSPYLAKPRKEQGLRKSGPASVPNLLQRPQLNSTETSIRRSQVNSSSTEAVCKRKQLSAYRAAPSFRQSYLNAAHRHRVLLKLANASVHIRPSDIGVQTNNRQGYELPKLRGGKPTRMNRPSDHAEHEAPQSSNNYINLTCTPSQLLPVVSQ